VATSASKLHFECHCYTLNRKVEPVLTSMPVESAFAERAQSAPAILAIMWPDSSETHALLESARAGDAAACNRLLERHREALRRMIGMRMDPILQRRVDASDIVQDVLVDAHRRLAEYLQASGMPFHLWLRHLARDRLIDAHRRHRGAVRRSVDREQPMTKPYGEDQSALDLAALARDRQLTPAAAAIHHELELRFQAAIETLDEIDREVVLMRHCEQLSNQETAQALALSEPAAGMRYLRAMRRLRTLLQEPPSQARSL
jgi:RNA polymerase sigma-70 factor (ECF subfamily)